MIFFPETQSNKPVTSSKEPEARRNGQLTTNNKQFKSLR
jgi:hypothetical protein